MSWMQLTIPTQLKLKESHASIACDLSTWLERQINFNCFRFFLGLQFSIIAFSKFSMCLFICVLYCTVKNDICWPTLAVNVQCLCNFGVAHLKLKLNAIANATTSPFKIISFTNYMTRPRQRGHVKSLFTTLAAKTKHELNGTERNGTD